MDADQRKHPARRRHDPSLVTVPGGTTRGARNESGGAVLASITSGPRARIHVLQSSDFERLSATLVFFAFVPAGAILGGIIGIIWSGVAASRARTHVEPDR